jgi:hypothetical protein
MSPETTPTKLCPVCGTRLAENATRCVVCGSEFNATPKQKAKSEKAVQGARMPVLTLSLPVALGLLAVFLVVGAGGVYFSLKGTGKIVLPTISPTSSTTPTLTLTQPKRLSPPIHLHLRPNRRSNIKSRRVTIAEPSLSCSVPAFLPSLI